MAKSTHGGKREGAGRKKKAELIKITIRVEKDALQSAKEIYKKKLLLGDRVSELLKQLIENNDT